MTFVKREHIERSGIEIIHEVSSLIIIFALIAKRMGIPLQKGWAYRTPINRFIMILQRIIKWFTKPVNTNPTNVFNCRDLVWITDIKSTRFNVETTVYYFQLYFCSGLIIKVCQDSEDGTYQQLEELRELFINNIGFSYLQVDGKQFDSVYINEKKK